jgi:hypothetical protein
MEFDLENRIQKFERMFTKLKEARFCQKLEQLQTIFATNLRNNGGFRKEEEKINPTKIIGTLLHLHTYNF